MVRMDVGKGLPSHPARILWATHSRIERRCPAAVPNKHSDIMETISSFHIILRSACPCPELVLRLQQYTTLR